MSKGQGGSGNFRSAPPVRGKGGIMGTPKEIARSIVEGIPEVRIRPMMGEWLVYFREHLVGTIEDGRLYLKDTTASRPLLEGAPLLPPHAGAKPAFLMEGRSKEELCGLLWQMIP